MKTRSLLLPAVSLSAEYLVMGYLLRRNILTYKAPPNNEGYDLICINPDPKQSSKCVRVQVKSRYQSDGDGGFLVNEKSFEAFDFLITASLNVGFFFKKGKSAIEGRSAPLFHTFPVKWVREHHRKSPAGWGSVRTKIAGIEKFEDEAGFEVIASKLKIPYPSK